MCKRANFASVVCLGLFLTKLFEHDFDHRLGVFEWRFFYIKR